MSSPRSSFPPRRVTVLAMLLVLLAALTPVSFFVDIPIARWVFGKDTPGELTADKPTQPAERKGLFGKGTPGDLKNIVRLSEVFAHGSGVLLILLAALALDPRGWRVLPRLALGAYGAGMLANVLKIVLARHRPEKANVMDIEVWDSFLGFFAWRNADSWQDALSRDIQSFPSGHAATAAGLACAMCRLYPRATWFFVGITVLACFQRIAYQAHYLSDVLAGAAVGVLFNLLLELPRVRNWLSGFEEGDPL